MNQWMIFQKSWAWWTSSVSFFIFFWIWL